MGNSSGCRRRSEPLQQQKEKNKTEYRLFNFSNQLISISDLKNLIESGKLIQNLTPQGQAELLEITAINKFWQTLNDSTKSKEVRDFALKELCKKGYKVAKFIDEQTLSIEYDQGNCHIKEKGQFDDHYKLISGSKEHIETGNIEDCKVCLKHIYRIGDIKILTLQSLKSPTTGKEVVFRGSFDEKHLDEKATLLNGVIEYKQQEHYTKITVKDGKIVSMLDYFQKDEVTIQSYFDFENTQKSSVKSYQKGKKHEVNIEKVAKDFLTKIPESLSIRAKYLTCIDTFRENCIQEVQKKIKNTNSPLQSARKMGAKTQTRRRNTARVGITTAEKDERDIDDLVEFIDGPQSFVRNALKARQQQSSTASSSKEPPQNTSLTIEDHNADDADDMVEQFYKQQQKLRQEFDRKKEDTRTIKISQAHEIKEYEIKEYEIKKFAKDLTKAVLPEMAYAPSQDSNTKTASSQASSSGLKPATTPSTTCILPKKANFYGIFEVSFLSEVLQAVTFILKEDSPEHATRDEQTKEYYYNLLNNITNTSNVNGICLEYLCEGLHLTHEQTEKLTMKILKRAKDNYDLPMDEFARLSALQKAYEQANRSYQAAEERWLSGEALKEQQRDML
jgi:hypothetical protein